MSPTLSVIVLAYDEEENVGPVIAELRAWLDDHEPDAEIVVVDDGSTDATAERARRALAGSVGRVVRHAANRGMGAGLKTGVAAARGEWVTFLPADGQIAPEAIGVLRAAAEPGVLAVFSVYDHRDDGAARRVLSLGVRALIQVVHGVRMRSDGPYLFRRSLFDPAQLEPDTFFLNFEFPIRVIGAGLPTRTVTIACRPRRAGASKTARPGRALGVARDLVRMRARVAGGVLRRALGRRAA